MSSRNRVIKQRARQSAWRQKMLRRERRGVLLLVVLSLLVLFMLIGTAFLMSSNQYRHSAKASAKLYRLGNYPTKLLDRALMQVVRDTNDPNSSVRYHSLLRDLYGSDGFEAQIYGFAPGDTIDLHARGFTTRYAAATTALPLGPTQGQFIDLFVKQLNYGVTTAGRSDQDPDTLFNETTLQVRDARHVTKLEKGPSGEPVGHILPLTKGYYNGALLTIANGPAAGQSTRVLEYEYIDRLPAGTPDGVRDAPVALFRFRVMAFPRADGSPLQINPTRIPEISDLAGSRFIVNGRPFNGTGAGYNELARSIDPVTGLPEPRLNAVETVGTMSDPTQWMYPEIALTPNACFFFAADPYATNAANDLWGARYRTRDPNSGNTVYRPLNPKDINIVSVPNRGLYWKYQNYSGPGDADESYDAADFQNMALALQTVTPRARGRVVQGDRQNPVYLDAEISGRDNLNPSQFLRLDLEDLPIPSFHRPDLTNYWFHRLLNNEPFLTAAIADVNTRARAILQPYGVDGIRGNADDPGGPGSLAARDQIVAIKRKISLRPLREDHPNFDGSNPASRGGQAVGPALQGITRNSQIAIPYWEAVGPWDVDNDNDGVPDSIWVDLGDPVTQAEDGTLYKPLYAFLIIDLDSKLNVNAHGLVDHMRRDPLNPLIPPQLDASVALGGPGNLTHDLTVPGFNTSNYMPGGLGYGPAEISLRSVFSPNLPGNTNPTLASYVGNPAFDDYARVLAGRPAVGQQPSIWGRHGSVNLRGNASINWTNVANAANETAKVRAGIPYDPTSPATQSATMERLTVFKFLGYPWWLSNYYSAFPTASSFSTPPDMMGRYALGLDYMGQPVVEQKADANIYGEHSLLFDSPYELNLAGSSRRETPDPSLASTINSNPTAAVNDDAPFATAELERVSRAHDADAGALPDRLWSVVDAFDPLKLVENQPVLVGVRARSMFNTTSPTDAQMLAAAQQIASENRRLVTTDSYDLPTPSGNFLPRLIYGADGQPGKAGVDDDNNGAIDDVTELGWRDSDDFYAIMNRNLTPGPPFAGNGAPTPPAGVRLVPEHPTIVDLLKYRIQYERWRQGSVNFTDTQLNGAVQYLLPPEVIAGKKLDLNRPFGDGIDNGDGLDNDGNGFTDDALEATYPVGDARRDKFMNGIVDDPEEGGEPFVDLNGSNNGRWDPGEPYYDLNGDGQYNPPRDTLWAALSPAERIGFDYYHAAGLVDLNGDGDYNDPLEGLSDGRPIDGNNDGDYTDPQDGRLRMPGQAQRQIFARHLYCMMLLLVDENYVSSENIRPELQAEGGVFDVKFLDTTGNFDVFLLQQQLALDIALQQLRDLGLLTPTTDTSTTAFRDLLGAAVNGEEFTDGNGNKQYDPGEPYTDLVANGKYDYGAKPTAYGWILRKLTARRIAQWAINVVDFRDSDSIMMPFEYDENPFDGWGVWAPNRSGVATDPLEFFPLDGNVATNENWGQDVPTPVKFNVFLPVQSNPNLPEYNPPFNDVAAARVDGTRELATREVVWGAERPELLITETLAFHDRRCTDEADPQATPGHRSFYDQSGANSDLPPDFDLDQKLKPRGSLFVELYNPSSPDGPRPAEFYDRYQYGPNANQTTEPGIMLNRLSDKWNYLDPLRRRSPVWRMTVLYEPFTGKISAKVLNPTSTTLREDAAQQSVSTDPDGMAIEMDKDAERFVYFTTGDDYKTYTNKMDTNNRVGDESDTNRQDDLRIRTSLADEPAEYAQRTIGGTTHYDPKVDQLKIRVPALPYRIAAVNSSGTTIDRPFPTARRYFVARTERWINGTPNDPFPGNNDRDIPLTPILPGRFAVVGSSGLQLYDDPSFNVQASGKSTLVAVNNDVTTRFVTPLSRLVANAEDEQTNEQHLRQLFLTRRIELWPFAHQISPAYQNVANPASWVDPTTRQQLLVAENGGSEFVRTGGGAFNVTDSEIPGAASAGDETGSTADPAGFGVPDNTIIDPTVAIPVEDLNISEPVEGYPSLRYRNLYNLNAGAGASLPLDDAPVDKITIEGEIEYLNSYDRPLDMEDALLKNGTTPNYRSVHLQRLADPTLPWNPPKYDDRGKENGLHQPELPVNPYLTVDSQSTDLTAYNGASQLERTSLPAEPEPGKTMAGTKSDVWQGNFFAPLAADELADAPEHVLWALIYMLKQSDPNATPQESSIIPPRVWYTPEEIRGQVSTESGQTQVQQHIEALAGRSMSGEDRAFRQNITDTRTYTPSVTGPPPYPRDGVWGAHLFRRVLPDDLASNTSSATGEYRQLFHLKSLERGAHTTTFDNNLKYDPKWEARLLWQQERPNARLFLKGGPSAYTEMTDLTNAKSKRVLKREEGTSLEETSGLGVEPPDYISRDRAVVPRLKLGTVIGTNDHVVNFVLDQTLGFVNDSYAPELDRDDGTDENALLLTGTPRPGAPEVAKIVGTNLGIKRPVTPDGAEVAASPRRPSASTSAEVLRHREKIMKSTFPWLAWNNRPFVSAEELLQVPAWSSSLLMHEYSVANFGTANPYDGSKLDDGTDPDNDGVRNTTDRYARQKGAFGHLLNFFNSQTAPAKKVETADGLPVSREGAPNYARILDFVEVPSRYVGTETLLSPELFNDVPTYLAATEPVGTNLNDASDPRFNFQPPFNKVSRERDPGRVNLNMVTGRRQSPVVTQRPFQPPLHWSEVYDGLMHRFSTFDANGNRVRADGNLLNASAASLASTIPSVLQWSHLGPAWRDVVLSRRGYVQFNADGWANAVEKIDSVPNSTEVTDIPDTFAFGLNQNFPSIFSNPFRSGDAGDLVPLPIMMRSDVDATLLRGHHYGRARDVNLETTPFASSGTTNVNIAWGVAGEDDDRNGIIDDIREAGFGDVNADDGDRIRRALDPITGLETDRLASSGIPLFAESVPEAAIDAERNPGMMYQPMTRLGNLVTTRSNVYAIWITVGYFEVQKAPDWNDPNTAVRDAVRARFGGTANDTDAATVRARALYDRVYPEGYTLGEELGTDTGNTNRQRAYYIIDRTEPVGFKPGEDLNVENMIRVRRRIE